MSLHIRGRQEKWRTKKSLARSDSDIRPGASSVSYSQLTIRRSEKVLGELYWQKRRQFKLREAETGRKERKTLDSQTSTGRKEAEKINQLPTEATFHGKGKTIQKAKPRAHKAEPRAMQNYFQPLSRNEGAPIIGSFDIFQNFCLPLTPVCFLF